jgi:uncharacterized phage infection (PIP) family protein YhgE
MLNLDCQINSSAKMIPIGGRGSEWKQSWLLLSIFFVVLCSGCGKSAKLSSATTESAASASAAEEPAFKIAEEQRKALEQAKQLELDLQNAADKQKREIEAATGEK